MCLNNCAIFRRWDVIERNKLLEDSFFFGLFFDQLFFFLNQRCREIVLFLCCHICDVFYCIFLDYKLKYVYFLFCFFQLFYYGNYYSLFICFCRFFDFGLFFIFYFFFDGGFRKYQVFCVECFLFVYLDIKVIMIIKYYFDVIQDKLNFQREFYFYMILADLCFLFFFQIFIYMVLCISIFR